MLSSGIRNSGACGIGEGALPSMKICMRLLGAPQAQQEASSSFEICLRMVSDTYMEVLVSSNQKICISPQLGHCGYKTKLVRRLRSSFGLDWGYQGVVSCERLQTHPTAQCDSSCDLEYTGNDDSLSHGQCATAD